MDAQTLRGGTKVTDLPRDSDAVSSEALQLHVHRRTFRC